MKKFTSLDEDLIKENAQIAQQFNEQYKSALQKLDEIKVALDDFAIKQVKSPRDWGYIGSLGHVNEELNDILEFLGLGNGNTAYTDGLYQPVRDNTLPDPPDGGSGVIDNARLNNKSTSFQHGGFPE